MEDTIYAGLVAALSGKGYFIENVEVVDISQEYLDEVAATPGQAFSSDIRLLNRMPNSRMFAARID